ncbi:MAG TPA: 4Fe-4S dicluster domain-containing protein [Euryarchaeota archaeon]|nr:4Fe-4S dicluster domain-containing protein [Euryarchaeota archaeon]
MYEIKVIPERCTGCGKCIDVCPKAPRIWGTKKGKAFIKNSEFCIFCGQCITVCPPKAIKTKF